MPASAPITATLSAAGLVCGFAVATASGSRPLGGVVLVSFAGACVLIWLRRDGPRTAVWLSLCGLTAFVMSHALGLLIGAWPSVLLVAMWIGALCWWISDRPHQQRRVALRSALD